MRRPLDPINISFIVGVHLAGLAALVYALTQPVSGWSIAFGVFWYLFCGLGITGGYHRLFSHPTFKTVAPVRAALLLGGAGSVQNSAYKWSADHRTHHAYTDTPDDPYSILKGLWWAHMAWIFYKDNGIDERRVKDLAKDPLVRFQHRFYVPLAIFSALVIPGLVGLAWGDPLGCLLIAGPLRLTLQWHATFTINSFAHWIGSRPYCDTISARDSALIALVSNGEGYHNFHHRFPNDFRNGVRWFHWDPTKWFVAGLEKVGLAWDLRRTPDRAIQRAREELTARQAADAAVATKVGSGAATAKEWTRLAADKAAETKEAIASKLKTAEGELKKRERTSDALA